MEFDKNFLPRPYETKALRHVNKVCHEDEISFGFRYNECEQHHRYCGYTKGYLQAIFDVVKILQENGLKDEAITIENKLLYGMSN